MARQQAVNRSIPIIPTLVVAAAVATMIALGIWQLERLQWKDALLARYQAIPAAAPPVPYPAAGASEWDTLYRRSEISCPSPQDIRAIAGRSAEGEAGWAYLASCKLDDGREVHVALGWSKDVEQPSWAGGEVAGILAPNGKLVADPPKVGLAPLAKPDPGEIPNNHLSYAIQWFLFALAAAVIYVLALRKRWREASV